MEHEILEDHLSDGPSLFSALRENKNGLYFLIGMGIFLVACIILLFAVYLFLHPKTTTAPNSLGIAPDLSQPAVLLAKVKALVDLPSDETPQIVPISDLAPFSKQQFFSKAHVGDVLIIYINSHIAVLYDPGLNKIVNMSKISIIIPPNSALP